VNEKTQYNYGVKQIYAINDNHICESEEAFISIYVSKKIELNLIANADKVKEGETVILTVNSSNEEHYEYEWYQDNVLLYEPTFEEKLTLNNYSESHHFYVKTSNDYCEATSNAVFVGIELIIPNIITPYNKNGLNDEFMTAKNGKPGYKVEIYNRYQHKIFEGNEGWDGTYRGAPAEPGTYFYRLFMRDGSVEKGTLEVAKF
jgi:gliding motility-associated-like protein